MKTCRGLRFDEKPNYGYLRSLFVGLASARNEEFDPYFDWLLKKLGRKVPDKGYYDFDLESP